MLKKNLESGHSTEEWRRACHFWAALVRSLILCVTFFALLPSAFVAQTTPPAALAPAQMTVYGAGIQTPLRFQGESVALNQVSLSMGVSALYDDNVFARNSLRLRDEALSFDSHLSIARQTEHLTATFDYIPFFPLYRKIDQYDRLNHAADLGLTYRLASRFFLGLHGTFNYVNGVYPSLTGQQIMSGPGSPTGLNQMLLPYTTRTLSEVAGLDLTFVKSRRTSLAFSGSYNQRKFEGQTANRPLYNGIGGGGSLTFQYSATEHTNFGILLLHQDTTYRGAGPVFGNRLRPQIESTFLSVASRLSPTVTVTVFGGPQYVHTIGRVSAAAGAAEHFQASGGASITKQVRATALDLSLQRFVSDSAGLYTSAIYSNATFGIRRRLVGQWEADLRGGAAEVDASLFRLARGRTDGLSGGIALHRPLPHGATFRVSYDTWHQLSKGTLPISSDFDRNQVAVSIDYQLKTIPFGR